MGENDAGGPQRLVEPEVVGAEKRRIRPTSWRKIQSTFVETRPFIARRRMWMMMMMMMMRIRMTLWKRMMIGNDEFHQYRIGKTSQTMK